MCDIWKANDQKRSITVGELQRHIADIKKLNVEEVVLSGGEPLMHDNLWKFCAGLKEAKVKVTMLSTGLLLKRFVHEVALAIDEVIVSLDGSREIHNQVRNIPSAYDKLAEGVQALRALKPSMRITGRTVLQRYNYFDFPAIVNSARQIGLDQISFLGADISTAAFNRPDPWTTDRISEVALDKDEVLEFEKVITASFETHALEYSSGFIAEKPAKMTRIVQYYKAVNGLTDFPRVDCNAPWVSAVMESNGDVQPCFFHKPYGNVSGRGLIEVLNSPEAVSFRRKLSIEKDPVCRKCVCSLKLGLLPSRKASA